MLPTHSGNQSLRGNLMSENKEQNNINSFDELRKELGLDETNEPSVSMLKEVLDETPKEKTNEKNGDGEKPNGGNFSGNRFRSARSFKDEVITDLPPENDDEALTAPPENDKKAQKALIKKQKAEAKAAQKAAKAKSVKKEKPPKPEKQKKEKPKKSEPKVLTEAPIVERRRQEPQQVGEPEKALQKELETIKEIKEDAASSASQNAGENAVIESVDEINNTLMYEYDPEGAVKKRNAVGRFFYTVFPNKKDSGKEKTRKLISVLSVLIIIGCGCYFGALRYQKYHAVNQSSALQEYVTELPDNESEADAWKKIFSQYPNVEFPGGMNIKYAKLYAINNQFVGWLSIPDTQIDVQVVKADDNEKYLKEDFYGNYSRYGCPFMDYRDNIRTLSLNTVIYGHHMKDGLMFAELAKYTDIEGFKESPTIQLSTLYDDYVFKIYAVFITNSKPEDDNGYVFNYIFTPLTSDEAFSSYISALDERKLYDTGVDIQTGDKLLTLSTCTYEFADARLVVVARLVRNGENPTVRVNKAELNLNPHYPAIWYSQKNEENPFASAKKWYPS